MEVNFWCNSTPGRSVWEVLFLLRIIHYAGRNTGCWDTGAESADMPRK